MAVGRLVLGICGAASFFSTPAAGGYLFMYSMPLHFGWLFIDYPDPARPGRLKGVNVSTPEFMAYCILFVALVATTILCFKSMITAPTQPVKGPSTSATE